ncbi:MAG: hypothetical protein RL136_105 [Planctomycetota bacterium]|jgi:hypothetical protein
MHLHLKQRLASLPAAALLAGCAYYQLRHGPESTPAPLRAILAAFFGHDDEVAARLVVGAELAFAAVLLVVPTRIMTVSATVAAGFTALACVSAGLQDGLRAMLPSIMILVFAVVATALAVRFGRSEGPSQGVNRRGVSSAWTALAAIAVATTVGRMASGMQFAPPPEDPSTKSRVPAIDLDMKPYQGSPLAESPIGSYLPQVVARIGTESAFIVFYNPHCDACHTLFETNFAAPRSELVFAIEIPPPPGAVIAAHDELGPIECPTCEFDMLAPGTLWLVAPPMTVKVERGIITCVADRFGGDCLQAE